MTTRTTMAIGLSIFTLASAYATRQPDAPAIQEKEQTFVVLEWTFKPDAACHILQRLTRVNQYFERWNDITDCTVGPEFVLGGPLDQLRQGSLAPGSYHEVRLIAQDQNASRSVPSDIAAFRTAFPPQPTIPHESVLTAIVNVDFSYVYRADCDPACTYGFDFDQPPPWGVALEPTETGAALITWLPVTGQEGTSCAPIIAKNVHGALRQILCFHALPENSDTRPPGQSVITSITNVTSVGADVTWTAADDDTGVVRYLIRCQIAKRASRLGVCGVSEGTGLGPFTIASMQPETSYRLWAQAEDIAGNLSIISGQRYVAVRTLSDQEQSMEPLATSPWPLPRVPEGAPNSAAPPDSTASQPAPASAAPATSPTSPTSAASEPPPVPTAPTAPDTPAAEDAAPSTWPDLDRVLGWMRTL